MRSELDCRRSPGADTARRSKRSEEGTRARYSLGLHSDIDRANYRGEHYWLPGHLPMEWLPSGLYSVTLLIIIFLPPAIVGLAAGLGVLWFINLFIPGALTKDSSSSPASAD